MFRLLPACRLEAARRCPIVSDSVAERTTLLPPEENFIRNIPGSLPSRAADNPFWLGRDERPKGALRILRAWHARYAESADPKQPLLAHVTDYLEIASISTWRSPSSQPDRQHQQRCIYSASNIRRPLFARWLAGTQRSGEDRTPLSQQDPWVTTPPMATILLRKVAGLPVSCMKTCIASPAGASWRSGAISNVVCT